MHLPSTKLGVSQGIRCMWSTSSKIFHTTNYSLHTLQILSLYHQFQSSFFVVSSCGAVFFWGYGELYIPLVFGRERATNRYLTIQRKIIFFFFFSLSFLLINENPVVFLFLCLQERHSWCCWTSPSWWDVLRPCCTVPRGQWLLIHKVTPALLDV